MFLRTSLIPLTLCAPGLILAAQTPSSSSYAPAPAASQFALPSTTLQPSLDVLHTAISGLSINRWKTSGAIRDEAQSNVGSIQRDIDSTLPGLLAAADAAPNSAARVLPAYRNVDALYDVLLRVDAAASLAAPADQSSALDQALTHLEDSRRVLGEQLQHNAEAQESQVLHLQAALKAVPPPQPPPPPAAVVKCVTPPVIRRKRPAAKPAAKPTPPANSQSSTTPSH